MAHKNSAMPKGYHSVTPYLAATSASKAIEFYKQIFDAKDEIQKRAHTEGICLKKLTVHE